MLAMRQIEDLSLLPGEAGKPFADFLLNLYDIPDELRWEENVPVNPAQYFFYAACEDY